MKQLILSKPHLLILTGIPGAGKTYFANHFAKTYSLPLISSTNTTKILFEKPNYSNDEQTIVRRINKAELEQILKTKSNVVYDGYTDTRISRYELTKVAVQSGYVPLIIWVQTDLVSSKRRALKEGVPKQQLENLIRKFTPPNDKENHLVISGKHLPSNQTRSVTNKLQSR